MAKEKINEDNKKEILLPITEFNKRDLFVAVNGKSYRIKRGCKVKVPLAVAEVIENANMQNMAAIMQQDEMEYKE